MTAISSSNEVSSVQRILWLLNSLYYQVLAVVTVVILWIFFESEKLNSSYLWHLVLSTVAYVPLMAAAIILFSEDNLVTLYIQRTKRYWIHGILLGISTIAVSVGIGLETHSKSKEGYPHFKSTHAILGLASWVVVLVAVVIGFVAGNTKTFKSFIKPVVAKFVHNFLGIAGFVLGIASLYKMMSFFERNSDKHINTGLQWLVGFITVWSLLAALKSLWSQLRGIFS